MNKAQTHPVSLAIKRSLTSLRVSTSDRILVGVSGGVDSMVLLYILHQLGHNVSAAHVNFNLRGEESHNDALFVKLWCEDQGVSSYELSKNTKVYAEDNDLNTQTAAREIRYEWWESLVHLHQFDFVATAHHLDDAIETVFLNLLRGTGIKGLKGIPHRRDFYIRPMLEVSRKEIESFAHDFEIPFRTDSSNLSDVYQRNRLRHVLIPLLVEMAPGFHSSMKHTLQRVNLEWEIWEQAYHQWQQLKVQVVKDGFLIHGEHHEWPLFLRWLEERGIPWHLSFDFLTSVKSDSGRVLTYEKYRLSRTHDGFYYEEIQPTINLVLNGPGHYTFGNFNLAIDILSGKEFVSAPDPNTEYVNTEVIQWPLYVRNIREGDSFQPIGMNGHTKKIQDLLVDHKLEMYEKERVLLLTNGDHILWVMGVRLDERAKVKPGQKEIYRIKYSISNWT